MNSSCVKLDGRFSAVRTRETNLGNLVTDIMLAALGADCALLNSGTLRSDTEHPAGQVRPSLQSHQTLNCRMTLLTC